jgi:integrase
MTANKKGLYGEGRWRKRGNSWQNEFYVPKGPEGKRHTISITEPTKAEVRARKAVLIKQIQAGVDIDGGAIFISDYLPTAFEDFKSKKERKGKALAVSTVSEYERAVKVLTAELGDLQLNRLTPIRVDKAVWTNGATPNVARKRYTILNILIKEALYQNLLESNVMDRVEAPLQVTADVYIPTRDDIDLLFDIARNTRYETPLYLQFHLGARIGELLALTWSDVNFETQRITIDKTLDSFSSPIQTKPTKNGESREMPITAQTVEVLRLHRISQKQDQLRTLSWADQDLIFPNTRGGWWDYSNYRRGLLPVIDESGLKSDDKKLCTHAFRHACAATLLTNGKHINLVKKFMGHKNVRTTDQFYGDIHDDGQDDLADTLSQVV